MPCTIEITELGDPRVAPYARLTEAQLRNRLEPSQGIFICESPKVIRVALQQGAQPVSLLTEQKHISGDAADIVEALGEVPIYTGAPDLLERLTGYRLTRGVLCAMRRPAPLSLAQVCEGKQRIVVINGVVDSTNIGAIFRSAAALGIEGVVLTANSCDPLNRRAVRVSMGSVFLVPWCYWDGDDVALYEALRQLGYKTAAMALTDDSVSLADPQLKEIERLAIVMGTEGDGLPHDAIYNADLVVRIPMHHSVDSLNVAAASAVAFWELKKASH